MFAQALRVVMAERQRLQVNSELSLLRPVSGDFELYCVGMWRVKSCDVLKFWVPLQRGDS
jgi:hypothetical protein